MLCLLPGDGGMGSAFGTPLPVVKRRFLPISIGRVSDVAWPCVFVLKPKASLPVKPRLRRDPGLRRAGNRAEIRVNARLRPNPRRPASSVAVVRERRGGWKRGSDARCDPPPSRGAVQRRVNWVCASEVAGSNPNAWHSHL